MPEPSSAYQVPAYMYSLAMKPMNGGSPHMDNAARQAAVKVTGMAPRKPPSFVTSRVPAS